MMREMTFWHGAHSTIQYGVWQILIHSFCRVMVGGVKVTRKRIRDSIARVDPEGVARRSLRTAVHRRRVYCVAGALSLWHFDGYHKLIRCVGKIPEGYRINWHTLNQFLLCFSNQ